MDVLRQAAALLARGEAVALATVVARTGSAPQFPGARLLLDARGNAIGTVGGGEVEARTAQRLAAVLAQGGWELLRFSMDGPAAARAGMICGGNLDVLVERVSPTPDNVEVFGLLVKEGAGAALVADLGGAERMESECEPVRAALGPAGFLAGEVEGCGPAVVSGGEGDARLIILEGRSVLVASCAPLWRAIFFGAGHLAREAAPLALRAGFACTVLDDRSEFAHPAHFPDGCRVAHLASFEQALDGLAPGPRDCLLIMTRGHGHDLTVLRQAAGSGAGYVGMVGSRRKRDAVYAALADEGVPSEALARVRCPIGVAIGARTPFEIAMSIVAELIGARAGCRGA